MDDQIRAHLETLEAAPGDGAAFRALEGIYRQGRRFEELVALLEGRARVLPVAEAAPLLAQAAELARQELPTSGRAEELYRALLTLDPASEAALVALATLAEERQDWVALSQVLERAGQAARAPADAARAALRLGRLFEEKLARRDRAAIHYSRAARLDPGLGEARERALDACLALRRFGQAKKLLDADRDAGADRAGLAAAYVRLGGVLALSLIHI